MAAASVKNIHINVTINLRRGKEEIELAKTELDRLHGYIKPPTDEAPWAKERIKDVTRMILLPDTEHIKNELKSKIDKAEQQDEQDEEV